MKQYTKHIRLIFMMAITIFALSSCSKDEDGDAGRGAADGLQSISYMSMNDLWTVKIEEGEAVDVNFKVVPASYASLIAAQPIDMLAFVPHSSTNATIEITKVSATDEGILTVTAIPRSTENGQFYLFALMVRYGDETFQTHNIKFWREYIPESGPLLQVKAEEISQALAE